MIIGKIKEFFSSKTFPSVVQCSRQSELLKQYKYEQKVEIKAMVKIWTPWNICYERKHQILHARFRGFSLYLLY